MQKYKLVNPIIGGKFNSSFSGHSEIDAAESAWASISSRTESNVPRFAFTLENEENKKLHHFIVKELMSEAGKNDTVNYSLHEMNLKLTDKQLDTFRAHVEQCQSKINQSGGAEEKKRRRNYRYDDSSSSSSDSSSSSSSSSDSDETLSTVLRTLKVRNAKKNMLQVEPISYYWYTPIIYDLDIVYVPSLVQYTTPYIELNLNSAFIN
jgi:hypothetical protein